MPEQRDDCLFCKLAREGDQINAADGFVAINDINPQAPVHVLVIPEHHVDSFREIGEFTNAFRGALAGNELTTIVAKVEAVGPSGYVTDLSLLENRYQFQRYLRDHHGKE